MVVNGDISRLAPSIRPFVEELFKSGLFSHCEIDLFALHSGMSTYEIYEGPWNEHYDRFKLGLPCAGYVITWEVIFDGTCSSTAPDFIFDDESFLCNCDLESIPSLVNWDSSDMKSFVNVISDLLKLYSKHQMQEAARNFSPSVAKWLDIETVEDNGLNVEVLHGSCVRISPPTMPRQNTLPSGCTSVLVRVPVSCDLVDSKGLQFSVQYIFKPHMLHYDEKIECSPQLEGWLHPVSENFKRRNRWNNDCKAFSDAVQSYTKDITDLLRKCVQDFKNRQELQMSLLNQILSKSEVSPSVLEFDFNDFHFSSFLLSEKRLLVLEIFGGFPRGRLFQICDDCIPKILTDIKENQWTDPNFDICNFLAKFDS